MACSDNKNPLQRGGTSQLQRRLEALKSTYVHVDEKNFADWIVFAASFSEHLVYYDTANKPAGNWKPFFDSDITAVFGSIAIQDIDVYRKLIKDRFRLLQSDEHQDNTPLLKETLGALFGIVFTLCRSIDHYAAKLPDNTALKLNIRNSIQSRLQPALQRLIAYYKAAKKLSLVTEADYPDIKVLSLPVRKASFVAVEGLSGLWFKGKPDWQTFYTGISEDRSIFGDENIIAIEAWDEYRRINHAANHNLFSGTFDTFLMTYAGLIRDAEKQLLERLADFNDHPPHYALFLAFLKLFRIAQDELNTITQRHLDFYYKEVLRLVPKVQEPNHAHVILELAKQVDEYLLPRDTLLKAGKDSAGKDVFYRLDRDVVFNKAAVSRLMAVYSGTEHENIKDENNAVTVNNRGRLFASPVINSADGLGAEIKTGGGEWHPFVSKTFSEGELVSVNMPRAAVGFALATPGLFLTEGERRIYVRLVHTGAKPFAGSFAVDAYLTAEKGWHRVSLQSVSAGKTNENPQSDATTLLFLLGGDAPAIVHYNSAVHGGSFNVDVPVMKIYLRNEEPEEYRYDTLKHLNITKAEVEVKVGLSDTNALTEGGIRNLMLSSDLGVLDPSKPFLPFGQAPKKDASFIIGNEEVFRKKNASFRLRMEWIEMPQQGEIDYDTGAENGNPKVIVSHLQNGKWTVPANSVSQEIFDTANKDFPASFLKPGNAVGRDTEYLPYNVASRAGFIKLTLDAGFGYDAYQTALTEHLIKLANGEETTHPGAFPYVPKLKSISLHYTASDIADLTQNNKNAFETRSLRFFHLYPFGEDEQHAYLDNNASIKLLPQFAHDNEQHNGEFYIGIVNLSPGQSVNILFQVLEGSTDPLLDKPDEHITWSYLSGNKWRLFDKQSVSDHTNQLIQSGIISFVLPDDTTTEHTILPTGYVWLRASVHTDAEAVCKLLGVHAQAAVVSFADNNNAPDFLNNALPAFTIAKLKEPVSAVRKIEQKYTSFGGRPVETDEHFYTRVSERLRHKSRAISVWDYEHLVLEAFPEIHRVKCLNHTKYVNDDYNEVAPGHITIITIPSLVNNNEVNPLRPYTREDVLQGIEIFLRKKISCHVQLKVRQPQFEEVMMDFRLRLLPGYEFSFYSQQLQQDITSFLTPWAFGATNDVQFGGKVSKSVLINFIEERSYVDYITEVKLYWRATEEDTFSEDMDEVVASTARSILVSVAPSKHKIGEIENGSGEGRQERCVDTWNGQRDRLPVTKTREKNSNGK